MKALLKQLPGAHVKLLLTTCNCIELCISVGIMTIQNIFAPRCIRLTHSCNILLPYDLEHIGTRTYSVLLQT